MGVRNLVNSEHRMHAGKKDEFGKPEACFYVKAAQPAWTDGKGPNALRC